MRLPRSSRRPSGRMNPFVLRARPQARVSKDEGMHAPQDEEPGRTGGGLPATKNCRSALPARREHISALYGRNAPAAAHSAFPPPPRAERRESMFARLRARGEVSAKLTEGV
jgi:hypothetical protein